MSIQQHRSHQSHQSDGRPAVAILKEDCPRGERLISLLGQHLADKGFPSSFFTSLQQHKHLLAPLFGHLLMQVRPDRIQHEIAGLSASLPLPGPVYTGSLEENKMIDQAIHQGKMQGGPALSSDEMRSTTWRGAAGAYFSGGMNAPSTLSAARVVIIGAGPAGILAARALANAGLRNILVLEKFGDAGLYGIWGRETPKRILHAIPFPLRFEQQVYLERGPQPGEEITSFLRRLVSPPSSFHWPTFPRVLAGEVVRVQPGDLCHTVTYLNEHGQEQHIIAPVVINAIGVGEPLLPSWGGAMTTDCGSEETGVRWQEVWDEASARRYHRRKLVFISLSNATLSMLWQIHEWNRKGMEIDYRVLSHYPQTSVERPHERVEHNGRTYRLYRDLEGYQLLRMAGDMHPFRKAFEGARAKGRIISQVRHWSILQQEGQRSVVAVQEQGKQYIPCDALYTLIGYGPRPGTLEAMGLQVQHSYLGVAHQDFDGEVQKEPGATGRARICPGYFCLGVRNGFNENEVLLPGLLHRLPNLVAGVILRCAEYAGGRQ